MLVTHSCPTFCDPMEYRPSGSSIHGILQVRILEWVAIPSPGDFPDPQIESRSPALQGDSLYSEPPGKPTSCSHKHQKMCENQSDLLHYLLESSKTLSLFIQLFFSKDLRQKSEAISSVQFNCSIMSDSLQIHGLQHARPPCPTPTPRVYSNSCQFSQWCHSTISSSVIPFSCLQSFPAWGLFKWISSSH